MHTDQQTSRRHGAPLIQRRKLLEHNTAPGNAGRGQTRPQPLLKAFAGFSSRQHTATATLNEHTLLWGACEDAVVPLNALHHDSSAIRRAVVAKGMWIHEPAAAERGGNECGPALLGLSAEAVPHGLELQREEMEDHRVFRQQMQHMQRSAGRSPIHGLDAVVISLPRSAERLEAFRCNANADDTWINLVAGVDGQRLDPEDLLQRHLIAPSALGWPRGQLGCALSHLRCLLRCHSNGQPLLVFEDDALLAPTWVDQLGQLLAEAPADWDLLLLGWNLDSCLQLEWSPGLSLTALFQPRFPDIRQLQEALGRRRPRQWYRLQKGLGLAGYVVSPNGAGRILEWALPLRTLPIQAPELPERPCFSLDGQLNSLYPELSAWACMPPLVLGANDKPASLTAQ